MAKGRVSGGNGLNLTARLNTAQAMKEADAFIKKLNEITKAAGISPSKTNTNTAFNTKPLTEYQAGLLKIKQEALDLAKQKAEQARADKQASLALQAALKEEARLKREQIAAEKALKAERIATEKALKAEQTKKKPTQVSNSQAEIDAYNKAQKGSILYTSAINSQIVALAKRNVEAAKQAIANGTLNASGAAAVSSSNAQSEATKKNTLTKKEQAQALAVEKLRLSEVAAASKNYARETTNARGSGEQMKATVVRLTAEFMRLSKAERESASGARMLTIIQGYTDKINALDRQTKGTQSGLSGFFDHFKSNILATLGPIALLTAAWAALKAAFTHNVEISDNFVDVQRTAKLSGEEVDKLGDRLKKINTRTNLEGLLDIGFEGGRLSVAKADLVGFIETVDQLAVVLKKELPGGAEAVAESLGKIVKIYKLAENEGLTLAEAMRKVGSLQLELAHSGGVTVKYLQDFTLGVAGTAVSAKIALPVIEAYGAVMSGAGTIASSAAISMTRLVTDLSVKRGKYFAIAQLADSTLTIEKFNNLINTDTNAALLAFFKGLKAGNPVQTEFNDRIRSVGITTGKVMNAVKTLANNQELLAEKTKIGTKAYEEGTSVAHNFELANNSLAASFDKIKNSIVNAFTDSTFSRGLAGLLNMVTDNRTESEKLGDEYEKSKHKAEELNHALDPLVNRYNELKSKGKLNRDEQSELANVIQQIATIVPDSATALNKYGDALDINTGKVREFTKAQKESLELQNREALKKANKEFEDAETFLNTAVKIQKGTDKAKKDWLNSLMDLGGGDSDQRIRQKAKDDVTETLDVAYKAAVAVRKLNGELSEAQKKIIDRFEKQPVKPKAKQEVLGTGELADEYEAPRTTELIKKQIKDLQEANKKLAITSSEFKTNIAKIKQLRKELKLANGGKDTEGISEANQQASRIKARNSLQKEIDKMISESSRKQMSADDAEVQSVSDKYTELRRKAQEYYDGLAEEEKNGKLKPKQRAELNVRLSGIDGAELNEKQAVIDKQSNARFKAQLAEQTSDFEEFENHKLKYGIQAANKRYQSEFSTAEAYMQSLEDQQTRLLDNFGDPSGYSEAQKEQLSIITNEIISFSDKRKQIDNSIYDNAFNAAKTYIDKVADIDKQFQIDKAALEARGDATPERIANLLKIRDEGKRSLNEENAYAKSEYAELMENMLSMTKQAVLERLAVIKAGYEQDKTLTPAQKANLTGMVDNKVAEVKGSDNPFSKAITSIKEYRKAVGEGKKDTLEGEAASKKMFGAIGEAAQASAQIFGDVTGALQNLGIGMDEYTQATIKNVTDILGGVAELAKGIKSADPVAIVSGSIKLLSSAIDLFNVKDKKLNRQIKAYQADLDSLSKAYKQLERDVQNAVGNDIYSKQSEEIASLQAQQQKLIEMRDAEAKKKKKDQGKINELNNMIDDIPNKIADINASISQNLIQGTFRELSNSLADSLTSAFKSGEDGIEAMNKSFDDFIANAIKNSLKLALLEPVVSQFTKELTEYAKGNGNSVVGFDFEAWKKKLDAAGEDFNKGLEESKDFFKGDNKNEGIKKTGLTDSLNQPTAERLEGLWRGTFDLTKKIDISTASSALTLGQMYQLAVGNLQTQIKIEQNTFRTANNTDRLERIENALISIDRKTVQEKSARV